MSRIVPLTLLLLLCAARPLQSQSPEAQLEGRVTVEGTGAPVHGAVVALEGTELATRTDSLGRWILRRVPAGPQMVIVRRIGYAQVRVSVVVAVSGSQTLDIELAASALNLPQLIVTADRAGRARGEIGTASVIERDAIANQVTSSIQGVLELLPGVALQPPGLDAAAQISLRALAQRSDAAFDIGASGTLITLDGVPLSNNANLQAVGVRGEIIPPASTAGGGIDLRRIPAAALERVEVIRGIPSVRWGDLTQGAIIVETRAAASLPELTVKFDPLTTEANVVGGHGWQDGRQALSATFNLAQTKAGQSLSSAATLRGAGQVAHRLQLGVAPGARQGPDGRSLARLTLDTRADWWRLRFDNPERVDLEPGRNSFQDDQGFRIGERARLALASGTLEWTAAFDAQTQFTRESRVLAHAATPFTDRVTEGRNIGTYVEGLYDAAYTLDGSPRLLYSRIEWERSVPASDRPWRISQMRVGAELRREWNSGAGYTFDIARPPQASALSGANGFDRPRRFDTTPPVATSAAYADLRVNARRGQMSATAQAGLRLDVLHDGTWWTSGARSTAPQPRITAQIAPRSWLRLQGGVGAVSKAPTIAQLFPAPQYFDLVNVNRFTPDPRERLAVLTTFIRDPSNPDLRFSRGVRKEVGIELDGGRRRGALNVTWFDDALRGAVTVRRDPLTLMRDRYALADTARGSGQPGRIVDPPTGADPIPIFMDRYVNGGRLDTRGVEFTATLPFVVKLRTRLEVSGAMLETRFATDDRDFGNVLRVSNFQVDTTLKRLAYFEGASNSARQTIITWRLVHHQPELGLVITATVQQRIGFEQRVTGRTDSLSFAGYITRTGELVPVPDADKLLPEFFDLRAARAGTTRLVSTQPNDWVMTLQVVKSFGANGRLSFYFFNALDKLATFGTERTVRELPSSRFGAELTLPVSSLFRSGR